MVNDKNDLYLNDKILSRCVVGFMSSCKIYAKYARTVNISRKQKSFSNNMSNIKCGRIYGVTYLI